MKKSIRATFSISSESSEKDTRFMNVVIDVLHTGLNYNDSIFEKDVVDQNVNSIKNTPILGFVKYDNVSDEIDFAGHEYLTFKTEDGIEEIYIGKAIGVIPESCSPRWIEKECDDGDTRLFLQVDGILWEKFEDSISIFERDIKKSHSMELDINSAEGYEDDDGIFHFTKFKFDGCCALGNDVEPAMINSVIRVKDANFSINEFTTQVKENLDKYFNLKNNDKEGEKMSKKIKDFSQTVMQQYREIRTIVSGRETFVDRWGYEEPRFDLVDIEGEEVIVTDAKNHYNLFSFPLSVDGDKPVIGFEHPKRKKVSYLDYEDGEVDKKMFDLVFHLENKTDKAYEVIKDLTENKEAVAKEFESLKDVHEALKTEFGVIKEEYDKCVAAEKERSEKETKEKKEAEFAKYEGVLGSNEDFISLKEQMGSFSFEEIESKTAILYARATISTNFSKNENKPITVGVPQMDDDLFVETKYGNIPVKK